MTSSDRAAALGSRALLRVAGWDRDGCACGHVCVWGDLIESQRRAALTRGDFVARDRRVFALGRRVAVVLWTLR